MPEFSVKKKLSLMMLMPLILVIIILVFVNYVYSIIEQRDEKNHWFSDVNDLVNQLYIVGYDVVMYSGEKRPRQQWILIANRVSERLDNNPFELDSEKDFIDTLRIKQRKISQLFNRMLNANQLKLYTEQRRQLLARQVLFQTQAIKNDLSSALDNNDSYYGEIRQRIVLLIVLIAFILLLSIAVSIYYLYSSISIPLEILKKWSREFVRGHLDKEIELDESNEFRHLADSFFELGWQLKQNHLELELIKNKYCQAELRNQLLLSHLDQCQAGNIQGHIDWNIEAGVLYLSSNVESMFGLEGKDNSVGFDQFANLIDFSERQATVYLLERCRDTGKEFETDCRFRQSGNGNDVRVHLNGALVIIDQHRLVSIEVNPVE